MATFSEIFERFSWRSIPGCPGRFVLTGGLSSLEPGEIVGDADAPQGIERKVGDRVLVLRFDGGGLISYQKSDGRFVHTLNTVDGLKRKVSEFMNHLG